jgi:hypothetical protein
MATNPKVAAVGGWDLASTQADAMSSHPYPPATCHLGPPPATRNFAYPHTQYSILDTL